MLSDAEGEAQPLVGRLLVISGASGSEKSSICAGLIGRHPDRYMLSVSATTRARRGMEIDGREYHFLDREEFNATVEAGEFLEYAEVFGNGYGTPRRNLEEALAAGKTLLLDIDVQGGRRLRELGEPGLYVWVDPPSPDTLRDRLIGRGTESAETLERRLRAADEERSAAQGAYDCFVVNDDLGRVVVEVDELAEKRLF